MTSRGVAVMDQSSEEPVVPQTGALTDGQLMAAFADHREGAALAALMERHGAMVWSVCRRQLTHSPDVEDAFQSTFLVLVQKAASIRDREAVANWLFGVAHQTAVRIRIRVAKQHFRERSESHMVQSALSEATTGEEPREFDLPSVIDEELGLLPAKYRELLVLCDVEGNTRREVAKRLSLPEGTVAGRLARGRALLVKRLARRGIVVTSAGFVAFLAQQISAADLPASLVASTLQAATAQMAGAATAATAITMTVTHTLTRAALKGLLIATKGVGVVLFAGWLASSMFHTTDPASPLVAARRPDNFELPVSPPTRVGEVPIHHPHTFTNSATSSNCAACHTPIMFPNFVDHTPLNHEHFASLAAAPHLSP